MKSQVEVLSFGLFLVCQAALTSCAEQPELIDVQRVTAVNNVAVLPFEDAPGAYGERSGTAVSGFVTSELAASNKFRILERSRLKAAIDEKDLQASDLVDPQTAVQVGKMLGVQAVIVGTVTQYDMDKTTVYVHVLPMVTKDYKIGATVRMIDVGSGEVIYAHCASGSSGQDFTQAGQQAAQKLLMPLVRGQRRAGRSPVFRLPFTSWIADALAVGGLGGSGAAP